MSTNGKIDALNLAVQEMLGSFAEEDDTRASIEVAIITFGGGAARLHQELTPAPAVDWVPMEAAGGTPMGAAFDLVTDLLEDRDQIPGRAYRPTVVLVSDGQPNDEWEAPLERLLNSERAMKASRFALGIGDDADGAMLARFLATPEARVFAAHEARHIRAFFRWVTMSVTTRLRSESPDSIIAIDPPPLDEILF